MRWNQEDRPTAQELSKRSTLATGQADDLKVDTGDVRFWLSRTGLADGEPFENTVTIELLEDDGWTTYLRYDGDA